VTHYTNISTKTILKLFFIPLGLYLVWINRDLIFALFIAFILMSALRPIVLYLHTKKKVPRLIASLLVVLSALVFVVLVVGTIMPPMLSETITFIQKLPDIVRGLNPDILKYIQIQEVSRYVPNFANQFVSIVGNVFSNTLLVFLTIFFSYYLLANERVIDENLIVGFLGRHMSEEKVKETLRIVHSAQERLAAWFWGQLTLMFAVGLLSYIGFSWIGMKYALPLAVLSGIFEALPSIGPTMVAAIATLIGFGQSPVVGFAALAVSFIVQQVENYFLVPYIMKKAVGLNPVITMLAVIIGMRLGGPLGALLAIPIYVLVESIYREVYRK
jgi:predicted PurR-regulated permease PerM